MLQIGRNFDYVHLELGSGFCEVIDKDTLKFEFKQRFISREQDMM
jgi:hypothetical protein